VGDLPPHFLNMEHFKKEEEFIKWINIIQLKINDIYFNKISLSSSDLNDLGKLIYFIYNIKEQKLSDSYYKKFIYHSIQNLKIVMYNDQINIKLKQLTLTIKCKYGSL
jgi:hypothetical protein